MELRELRTLLAVARSGSFTEAAAELGYTQSAVSQHIAHLEATVGRTLLLRRPVRLTEAGTRLAEHAAHVVQRLDVARSELALTEEEPVELRVAVSPRADTRRVARALRIGRTRTPARRICLVSASNEAAVAHVASGRCELAIVDGVVAPNSPLGLVDTGLLRSFLLSEEEVVVAVPRRHPLRGEQINLDALVDAQWVVVPELLQPSTPAPRAALRLEGTDLLTVVELVAAGHGLALLPRRVCERQSGLRALRIAGPALTNRSEVLVLRSAVERHRSLIDALLGSEAG